jgi:hypothetical protein
VIWLIAIVGALFLASRSKLGHPIKPVGAEPVSMGPIAIRHIPVGTPGICPAWGCQGPPRYDFEWGIMNNPIQGAPNERVYHHFLVDIPGAPGNTAVGKPDAGA